MNKKTPRKAINITLQPETIELLRKDYEEKGLILSRNLELSYLKNKAGAKQ